MGSGRLIRRSVALVAAYALALQALLLAAIPAVPAAQAILYQAASYGVLCAQGAADPSHPPPAHEQTCAAMCAVLAHGTTGPLPPDFAAAIVAPAVGDSTLMPRHDPAEPRLAAWIAPPPRGPPLA